MNCDFQVVMLIFQRFPSGLKPHKAPSLPDSGFFSFTNGEISHIRSVGRCLFVSLNISGDSGLE